MSDDENVVDLGSKRPNDFDAATSRLQREMTNWERTCAVLAERKKIAFDSYVAVGFTEDQALDLVLYDD